MIQRNMRIAFFGTPEFSATTLEALCEKPETTPLVVVTQPDRPAGRGGKLKESAVKVVAKKYNLPILQPEKIRNNAEFLASFQAFGPFDIAVIVAFGQIIPAQIINIPDKGFINIHASLLPRWRGAAPMQRAILAQDEWTGVALMKLEAGLDTGPVYASYKIRITDNDTLETIHDRLAFLGSESLIARLPEIIEGTLTPTPQPNEGITYAEKISNEEAEIDWNKTAREVSAKIRAFSPFPGAFSYLSGKRIKIYKATVKDNYNNIAKSGEIITCDKKNILEVQCGDGVLSLQEVQLEGKRRMHIAEYLCGNQVNTGMCFSSN